MTKNRVSTAKYIEFSSVTPQAFTDNQFKNLSLLFKFGNSIASLRYCEAMMAKLCVSTAYFLLINTLSKLNDRGTHRPT